MARRYELKERAVAQAETRRRIVDATVALHREVGPARTTVAEIARRAGVGRVTVYNHFPDDVALLGACSAQWVSEHPPPDPRAWAAI
jgi:AcrR family transcriptional regulator